MNKITITHTKIARSLLALMIIAAPLTSFAKDSSEHRANDTRTVRAPLFARIADAFDARFHLNVSTKPVISGITAPTVLAVGQEGTWTINASDPKNGSLTYAVDWDDSASMAQRMNASPVQTSTFTHTYTSKGTYKVTFTVTNADGAKVSSSSTVHVTDTVKAPVITAATATVHNERQATITWKTDVRSNSSVWYSTTSPVSTTGTANAVRAKKTRNHKIVLNKLEPGTTYYVIVGSSNNTGSATSSPFSFTTLTDSHDQSLAIDTFTGDTSLIAGQTTTLTVVAHDSTNHPLSYSMDWGDVSGINLLQKRGAPVFSQSTTFEHEYATAGTYTATVTVQNDAGQKVSKSLTITVSPKNDTTAPTISSIFINDITGVGATVEWHTTEKTSSKLYRSTTNPLDKATAHVVTDTALVTAHATVLSGLSLNTSYYYVIEATDASGNMTTSSQRTFTTAL
jgi:PKD repeat protein